MSFELKRKCANLDKGIKGKGFFENIILSTAPLQTKQLQIQKGHMLVVFHLPFDHLPPHILYHLPHLFCIFCHLIFVSSATQFFISFATPF